MLARRAVVKVADNSGAKNLVVIGLGRGLSNRYARLGEIATCVVSGANPNGQVKDHQIVKALIVRTKKETKRADGSYIRFSDNAAVICDEKGNPIGTRVFGPVAKELKEKKFNKIVSQAKEVI